ncbi:MAG: hypothetical protein ACETWR_16600 [Anaerolineae bacterium]
MSADDILQYMSSSCQLVRQKSKPRAGAMEGFGRARRNLLWELGSLVYPEEGLDIEVPVEPVTLSAPFQAERLGWEVELLGLTPSDHLVGLYREALRAQGVLSSGELEGQRDA